MAMGATYSDERAKYAYFSVPYRFEENSLFLKRGDEGRLNVSSVEEFLADVSQKSFKLAVVDGFVYAHPAINDWVRDPKNQPLIYFTQNDLGSLDALLDGKVDGFLADRISGATNIWRMGKGDLVNEVSLNIKTPIHLMFSKKSISEDTVALINEKIVEIKESDEYSQIVSWYLHPVLLLQTVDSRWFMLIELIGTISFAISGLVIAYRDRATLFGAMLFAIVPSLGGSILRDVIFDRFPQRALQYPIFLYAVIATLLVGIFIVKLNHRYAFFGSDGQNAQTTGKILAMSESLGLAAFTISGIVITVATRISPLWLFGPFFALLTGVGGGIFRDLLSKRREIQALKGPLFGEIAIFWGFFFSVFLVAQAKADRVDLINIGALLTIAGILVSRIIVVFFNVKNFYFNKE